MPTRCDGGGFGELFTVIGFLAGLPLAIPTLTRLMLGNPDECAVPIDPSGSEVRDLPGPEAEAAPEQTDEPRLEATWGGQLPAGLQQEFELAVVQDILMGVTGGQRLAVPVRPFVIRRSRVVHPLLGSSHSIRVFSSARQQHNE